MRPLPSCHLLVSGSFPLNLPLPNCCPNIRCVLKCLRGHRSSADEDDWWTHPVTRSNFHPYFSTRPLAVSFPPSSLAHIRAEYNLTVELIPFTTECPNKRTQLLVFLVRRISSAFQFSSFRPRRGTATPKVRRCVTSARRHRRVCPPPKRDDPFPSVFSPHLSLVFHCLFSSPLANRSPPTVSPPLSLNPETPHCHQRSDLILC